MNTSHFTIYRLDQCAFLHNVQPQTFANKVVCVTGEFKTILTQ